MTLDEPARAATRCNRVDDDEARSEASEEAGPVRCEEERSERDLRETRGTESDHDEREQGGPTLGRRGRRQEACDAGGPE